MHKGQLFIITFDALNFDIFNGDVLLHVASNFRR